MNRHNSMWKVIHWKLCKKLKFVHTTKGHVQKLESVLENETHQCLWDFEIDLAENRVKIKESEKRNKYLDRAGELKSCGT